jgi:hypothetical protein
MVRKTRAANTDPDGRPSRRRTSWIIRLGKGVLVLLMLAVLAGAAGMYTFRACPCPHLEKIEPLPVPSPPPEQPPSKDAKQ